MKMFEYVHKVLKTVPSIECYESVSHSIVTNSLQSQGLQPTRLLCPWNSPGKNNWSELPYPSPGDLPDPGIEPGSPTLQADSLSSGPPGKPY